MSSLNSNSIEHLSQFQKTKSSNGSGNSTSSEPYPLFRELPPPEKYPIDTLGSLLGGTAKKLREVIKAPDGICGQSVLAAAALAVQSRRDFEIDGRQFPLSENFMWNSPKKVETFFGEFHIDHLLGLNLDFKSLPFPTIRHPSVS